MIVFLTTQVTKKLMFLHIESAHFDVFKKIVLFLRTNKLKALALINSFFPQKNKFFTRCNVIFLITCLTGLFLEHIRKLDTMTKSSRSMNLTGNLFLHKL
jgi:hypothetical protein